MKGFGHRIAEEFILMWSTWEGKNPFFQAEKWKQSLDLILDYPDRAVSNKSSN